MLSRCTSILVLATFTLQGVFGALQGSAFICFGGGHQHAPEEVVAQCDKGCSHQEQWLPTASDDTHIDECDCTDFELDLIVLLALPRTNGHDLNLHVAQLELPIGGLTTATQHVNPVCLEHRGPPQALDELASKRCRTAVIRCTRLLI